VVPRIDPDALRKIVRRLPQGSVLVSGTNGKTTTTRMISEIVRRAGHHPIHNRSGANLITGITAAVATHASLSGQPDGDLGLFEVDEAHVPAAVDAVHPRVLALNNVFRDQLDRYGEVDMVAQTWRRAIHQLDPRATLVVNADDPIVAYLAEDSPCRVVQFGVEDPSVGGTSLAHEADRRLCPRCGARLGYSRVYYGHVGHYRCTSCGWERVRPDVALMGVDELATGARLLHLELEGTPVTVELPLAGLYNAYNALAATAITHVLGIGHTEMQAALGQFSAVFGRQERIDLGAGSVSLALVKNPVGFNQVLATLRPEAPPTTIVIAINDLFADGTDVSWLWDVDFELLAKLSSQLICSGLRAEDMAVRLKYALVASTRVAVESSLERAIELALERAAGGEHVMVYPTYTAMLAMRERLQRRGYVLPFWED